MKKNRTPADVAQILGNVNLVSFIKSLKAITDAKDAEEKRKSILSALKDLANEVSLTIIDPDGKKVDLKEYEKPQPTHGGVLHAAEVLISYGYAVRHIVSPPSNEPPKNLVKIESADKEGNPIAMALQFLASKVDFTVIDSHGQEVDLKKHCNPMRIPMGAHYVIGVLISHKYNVLYKNIPLKSPDDLLSTDYRN